MGNMISARPYNTKNTSGNIGGNVQGVGRHLVAVKYITCMHKNERRQIVLPLEVQNRSEVSVEDDASHKSIISIWKEE